MKSTLENNRTIAEFMGKEVITEAEFLAYEVEKLENKYIDTTLKYNSDWNWLMEVVEKIESLGNYVGIFSANTCEIKFQCFPKIGEGAFIHSKESKIEAVYNAVVAFIEWYNSAGKETKTEK